MTNKKIILRSRPSGKVSPDNFKIINMGVPEPGTGEVLLKTKYFSVDPYMRNRMNNVKSYIPPYELNQVMTGDAIAEVVESNVRKFKSGDLILGALPWQQYWVAEPDRLMKIDIQNVSPTAYLGITGMTGLTAYFGLLDIGKPKRGETVVISGAAGAVGSVAGQIAKLKGCNVVGIVGSDAKVEHLKKDLQFDDSLNYKTISNLRRVLRKKCPQGVDIYFDNVGGEISDAVYYLLNDFARIVLCGQISLYNTSRLNHGPRLLSQLLVHRVKMQGFIVFDYARHFATAREQLLKWVASGKLKNFETIIEGFDKLPQTLISLFRGDNIGKQIVKV